MSVDALNDKTPGAARDRSRQAVTMEMVGRLAGVSQVTVSRALSDPKKVSPATLKKIQDAIVVTGFVPNALAGALASRRSRLISALVPSVTNIVYASTVKSFIDGMREHGYQIMLSETGYDLADEEALIATHLSRRPDAIMLTGTRHTANARKMLLAAAVPVVEVWDITETPIDLCVGFSHAEAGRAVARFLAEAGHERVACVTVADTRALWRKDAFVECFRDLRSGPVSVVCIDGTASLGRGREGGTRLFDEEGFNKGAVFCSSDQLAHGVIIEAQSRGLSVPGDIAIVGFGDQDFAPYTAPPLTSVHVDREALGRLAAEAVLGRIAKSESVAAVTDIGFEIVRRKSA